MQTSLELAVSLPKSVYEYGERSSGETHGVVLTKPHVVNLILDLVGYTAARDLGALTLLEPACGHGAFLVTAAERLVDSARLHNRDPSKLDAAILAYDIDAEHVVQSRDVVADALVRRGLTSRAATRLVHSWIIEGDFLLAGRLQRHFDAIVGNPPYVRIEQLSPRLQEEYRRRYVSLYDRADLYVAFIERGLNLLSPEGVLSFICADRWILNRYGAPLRRLLAERFQVRCYVDLHSASPFESEVIAYPSIFAISPGKTERVHVGKLDTASPEECAALLPAMANPGLKYAGVTVSEYPSWFEGDAPWVLSSPAHLETLRALEARFAPIEDVGGTRVGIGVATGNDKVYILEDDVDIEPERRLPLVMRDDIEQGRVRDARRFVINVFREDGKLVDLRDYPKLARYLDEHEVQIRKRHVAKKNAANWFRTIDRVWPELVNLPKLLIPDIAGSNEVAFDEGKFYPHHNLYFVISKEWDMEALGGLLSSRVALFFVWSYAVKMRGGYLRFQAQYLRRIRLPSPKDIKQSLMKELAGAFRRRDFARLDELALRAYDIGKLPEFNFVDTRK
ncbi:Eco57I restriction-modification methylase domain-containing protein [Sorangium sp. So ce375]|uniref:Eco57I restriction-modification methylase domain-containing protein n=1 Tax=Sorangium sp. So ce375 TaxID=3133306 RepID=UPI003F5BC841